MGPDTEMAAKVFGCALVMVGGAGLLANVALNIWERVEERRNKGQQKGEDCPGRRDEQ